MAMTITRQFYLLFAIMLNWLAAFLWVNITQDLLTTWALTITAAYTFITVLGTIGAVKSIYFNKSIIN